MEILFYSDISDELSLTRGAELPGPGRPEVPDQTGSPPLPRQHLSLGVMLAEALPVTRVSDVREGKLGFKYIV